MFGSVKEAESNLADQRELLDAMFEEGNPTGIKAICDVLGLCGATPRRPLMPATKDYRDRLYSAIAAVGTGSVRTEL